MLKEKLVTLPGGQVRVALAHGPACVVVGYDGIYSDDAGGHLNAEVYLSDGSPPGLDAPNQSAFPSIQVPPGQPGGSAAPPITITLLGSDVLYGWSFSKCVVKVLVSKT